MLVASFNGLYCSITHLHDYKCQPASLMNTQQLYFSLHVIPCPGVDHLIELRAQTYYFDCNEHSIGCVINSAVIKRREALKNYVRQDIAAV